MPREVDAVLDDMEESDDDEDLSDELEVSVPSQPSPLKCGCGKPKNHIGMCVVRRKKADDNKRIAESMGVKPKVTIPDPIPARTFADHDFQSNGTTALREERRSKAQPARSARADGAFSKSANTSIETLLEELYKQRQEIDDKISLLERTMILLKEHTES
jgi:hypothetical protein